MTAPAATRIRPVRLMSGGRMTIPMSAPPGGGPDGGVLAAPPARRRPGRIWYLVPLAVFLAGVAWLVAGLLSVVIYPPAALQVLKSTAATASSPGRGPHPPSGDGLE